MLTDLQKIDLMRGLAETIELVARGETNSARILLDDIRAHMIGYTVANTGALDGLAKKRPGLPL